jgi:CBS domain-containing protein
MKVQDVMTNNPRSCGPETNLAAAAVMMWDNDCGAVPVVDGEGKVLGMITDRDICIALATRHQRADDVTAGEVISRTVATCAPDEDIHAALKTMQNRQLRRLPVVDANGRLQGILSLSDIVRRAENTTGKTTTGITYEDVVTTLKAICEPHKAPLGEAESLRQAQKAAGA